MFYIQNVYGFLDQSMDAQAEVSQAGVEYIGVSGSEADAEVVSMAIKALEITGLKGFKLELGQVAFFKGLIADASINEEQEEKIRNLIDAKKHGGTGL